jgi:hypothetical protein
MTKETHTRPHTLQQSVETGCRTNVARAMAARREFHAGGRIMHQDDISAFCRSEPVDFVPRVVPPRIPLQKIGSALIVRRAVASANAADPYGLAAFGIELHGLAISEVEEPGQNLGSLPRPEPFETLVVPLNEHRPTRNSTTTRKPSGEITGAVMRPGRAVNGSFVRPNAEVTYVQNPIESNSEGRLKSENILVQAFDCAVNITGRAKKDRACLVTSGRKP